MEGLCRTPCGCSPCWGKSFLLSTGSHGTGKKKFPSVSYQFFFLCLLPFCTGLQFLPWAFCTNGVVLQLEASMNQELNQQIPQFNLPSKILCRVVHVRLLVYLISYPCFVVCLCDIYLFILLFWVVQFIRRKLRQMKCMLRLRCILKKM